MSMLLPMDTSKELVELVIHEDWWLWRGFRPFSRVEERFIDSPELDSGRQRLRDHMDASDFKEQQAFPLLKPSIDVFGVPRRSRKQRGWYQVRSSPPVVALPQTVTQRPIYSAADLPPELVSTIAVEVSGSSRQLSLCARTCRHWATVLQPRLFKSLTLRSHAELVRLHDIRCTSLTNLAQHRADLMLHMTLDEPPAVHLVHRLKKVTLVYMSLTGPLPASRGRSLRSLHGTLPRTLPNTYMPSISRLSLHDINFRLFRDLMELLWELHPFLELLEGTRLTWQGVQGWPKAPRKCTLSAKPNTYPVFLTNCMPREYWLALLLTGRQLENTQDEHTALVRQVEERLANTAGFAANYQDYYASSYWTRDGGGRLDIDAHLCPEANSQGTARAPRLVRDLQFRFTRGTESWIASVDWVALCRTVASFSRLEHIVVQIDQGSEQHAAFMQHAHEHLETLSRELEVELEVHD